jgi:signal transduction histidine kinase
MVLDKDEILLIAHDLNNPLSALMANLGFIASTATSDPDVAEAIQDSVLTQQSLKRLVENLNALALLEDASLESGEVMKTDDVLATIEAKMTPHALPASFTVKRACAPDAGYVRGSKRFLELALENLVATSMAHAPAGSVIELRGRRIDAGTVGLGVLDQGLPVPEDIRPFMLRKETQLKLKIPRNGSRYGRGLGLYVASLIARRSGGSLEVGADERGWSRFEIVLPDVR